MLLDGLVNVLQATTRLYPKYHVCDGGVCHMNSFYFLKESHIFNLMTTLSNVSIHLQIILAEMNERFSVE